MTDRCDCPYPDPMTYGGPNPLCPEHGDPDAILASETYTDRRGQIWHDGGAEWSAYGRLVPGHFQSRTPAQMRLKIVRERHRSVCPGLRRCANHPVPHVIYWRGSRHYAAYDLPGDREETAYTLADAITAARRMTGEQK